MNPTRGFTLIEISIVLVIIGLIVGGIIAGAEMIKGAEIRAQVSQIEKLATSAQAFRLKYSCLPGDCNRAENYGLGVTGGPGRNGNGDGAITYLNSAFNDPAALSVNHESLDFWYHLAQASLVDGSFTGFTGQAFNAASMTAALPAAKAGYGARIMATNFGSTGTSVAPTVPGTLRHAGNGFYFFVPNDLGHGTRRTGIPPIAAYQIDAKIDDGLPHTGNVGCTEMSAMPIGLTAVAGLCGLEGTNTWPCTEGGVFNTSNAYAMSTSGTCGPVFANRY